MVILLFDMMAPKIPPKTPPNIAPAVKASPSVTSKQKKLPEHGSLAAKNINPAPSPPYKAPLGYPLPISPLTLDCDIGMIPAANCYCSALNLSVRENGFIENADERNNQRMNRVFIHLLIKVSRELTIIN